MGEGGKSVRGFIGGEYVRRDEPITMKSQFLEAILGALRLSVLPFLVPLIPIMMLGAIPAAIYFRRMGLHNAIRMVERGQEPLWIRIVQASPKPHHYYDRKMGRWRTGGL